MLLLLLLINLYFLVVNVNSQACEISLKQDLGDPQPLLISNNNGIEDFVLPNLGTNRITLQDNDAIEVFCPGSFVMVNKQSLQTDLTQVNCLKGKFILNGNKLTSFQLLTCSKKAKNIAQPTGKKCLNKHTEFQIGYPYKNSFLSIITGCFDESQLYTLYTVHTISKAIAGRQLAHRRCPWGEGSFYEGIKVDDAYGRVTQRISLNKQLGLSEDSEQYICKTGGFYFLSRGHLAPKADFIYGSQQDVTFNFINAIPQWQIFNIGNWKTIEAAIQNFAMRNLKDLKIYTGTFEILAANKSSPLMIDLYLYVDGNKKILPIPKYLWKVVYDEVSNDGIGIVGVNNPYLESNDLKPYTLCPSVQCNFPDLRLNPDIKYGYVYCCRVDDLRKIIPNIPRVNVGKLLV